MLLILALCLFFLVHLVPFKPEFRQSLIKKLGPARYKWSFRLTIASIVILGIYGWQQFPNRYFYEPDLIWKQVHIAIMFPVVFLWVMAETQNNFKRYIRHPMLNGVQIATLSHLLANGDLRSMIFFVSFLIFATWAIRASNLRDGLIEKPKVSRELDKRTIKASIIVYVAIFALHGVLFGMPVHPYVF